MFHFIKRELLAGITVSIVALPLALAFGIQATGDSNGAIIGLYGAIITGFFAALFGGTPKQVTGPTGPITIIFTGIVVQYGLTNALIAAFIGGIFQILFGVLKLGNYLKYIPLPVVSGFMNGIAIIIIISQLNYVSSSFLIVFVTIVFMLMSSKWLKWLPASLTALILGTVAVVVFEKFLPGIHFSLPFGDEFTIFGEVKKIGEIPRGLPQLHLPAVDLTTLVKLFPPALSIAILGSIDSLLTSIVMDNMTGTKHKSNKELIGQGIGNAVAGLFGAMPGAGATVRSVVNLRSGGETALSAMIHSVFLLMLMLVFGEWASEIPLAVLAGILIVTGITMFDYDSIKILKEEPKPDAIVMVLTMVLTVAIDLMVAVGVGIVLSALVFMKRMSEEGVFIKKRVENGISIYKVEGPFYFGMTDTLLAQVSSDSCKTIVLEMDKVPLIDATGAQAILQLNEQLEKQGQTLYLTGLQRNVKLRLRKMKIFHKLGSSRRFGDTENLFYYIEHGFRKSLSVSGDHN